MGKLIKAKVLKDFRGKKKGDIIEVTEKEFLGYQGEYLTKWFINI